MGRTIFWSFIMFISWTTAFPEVRDEKEAEGYLELLDSSVGAACHDRALKEWLYSSNLTDFNRKEAIKSAIDYANFWKKSKIQIQMYDWETFEDPIVRRQFKLLSTLGASILPHDKLMKYNQLSQTMESTYAKAKVCNYYKKSECSLSLEPELTEIMKENKDPEALAYYWTHWREKTGAKIRGNFSDLVELIHEISILNNFSDASHYYTRAYESKNFKVEIENLWVRLRPLYYQLHAYVRGRLRNHFGENLVPKKTPIPAHLLGNMWGQTWDGVYGIVRPFPNRSNIDVTDKMKERNLQPLEMVRMAEDFFTSIGFDPLPQAFWRGSIFEKPKDREMICHASAWDMCNQKDFWIKQCTQINMDDLITIHHEMGHIQYQIMYKNLPKVFREGANPGFHEAIGDLIALSVQTPNHLRSIGLLDPDGSLDPQAEYETDINFLMKMALEKIAFLPFGYLIDLWRWNIYEGKVTNAQYNCEWWRLRLEYQGVQPPDVRNEKQFDPGSKYHIAANVNYIRYFASMILQFQFHEALCNIKNAQDDDVVPFHKCDIYGSHEAGRRLRDMLSLGASRTWREAMSVITDGKTKEMDAIPMIRYFMPLYEWLKAENEKNGEFIGWEYDDLSKYCSGSSLTSSLVLTILFNIFLHFLLPSA